MKITRYRNNCLYFCLILHCLCTVNLNVVTFMKISVKRNDSQVACPPPLIPLLESHVDFFLKAGFRALN